MDQQTGRRLVHDVILGLLRERGAIHASERLADGAIGQAQAMRDALASQRGSFGSIGSKLMLVSRLTPQINSLIVAISRRKSHDKIVLGLMIGVCAGTLLVYAII